MYVRDLAVVQRMMWNLVAPKPSRIDCPWIAASRSVLQIDLLLDRSQGEPNRCQFTVIRPAN